MKKLKNDFTTKQQSERLLALGMPRLSANFYYDDDSEVQIVRDPEFELQSKGYFPCWSVGRLIEIHLKCCTTLNQNDAHIVISRFGIETGGLLQNMYDMVGECALLGKYDFLKLEE